MQIMFFQPNPLPYCQLRQPFIVFSHLEVIEALLEFHSRLLEGLESFLGSGDLVQYQIYVDGGCHAYNEFMEGHFKGVMLPRVMHIFCYWQELCPASRV
jgi:hypothetical protein